MLQFIVPTEVVDLPSKGIFYGEAHPLHNCETIEIRHMTAKEEDILTSTTLLKKGMALDKMLQSVIVNKDIKVEDLLLGDKNALLVHSRVYGYGPNYSTAIVCPACGESFENDFDLTAIENKELDLQLDKYGIESTDRRTFLIELPKSKYNVEFRLLTSRDETAALGSAKEMKSLKLLEAITVSLNDQTDHFYIKRALSSLPIIDASILKRAYAAATPDINLTQEAHCPHCAEISEVGVPLDAGFFWPEL
tara:strand:- start:1050 stop:1799 length:750 start_codon:yes stop_codon:yes gene_type:complete